MKNIAFVIESLNLGGAETSLVTLLNNLDYSKYNVDLILFSKENFFLKYIPAQVNVIFAEYPKLGLLDRISFKISKALRLSEFHPAQLLWPVVKGRFKVFDKKYDIVHAYNQGFVTYYTADYINADVKFAWINIDYQKVNYNIDFDNTYYKKFDQVIAISDEVQRGFEEELKKINAKIPVALVKLFTDEKILNLRAAEKLPITFDPNKINIVTTCRLTKQKGLHLAVESCKALLDKGHNIHWYVVGEGTERAFLENLIAEHKVGDHFTLFGITDNPFPFMKASDIYVQTSLFEGWGLTVIEAVLLQKLVVTTNFPTAYDIIEDNKTGLIAEMNSPSIVSKIEQLIRDQNLKNTIADNLSKRGNADREESLAKLDVLMQ